MMMMMMMNMYTAARVNTIPRQHLPLQLQWCSRDDFGLLTPTHGKRTQLLTSDQRLRCAACKVRVLLECNASKPVRRDTCVTVRHRRLTVFILEQFR